MKRDAFTLAPDDVREIRHFHLFCGLGGGAKGFNKASPRVGNMVGKFRCLGGVDVDAPAIRDFERLTAGHYGVVPWGESCGAVSAAAGHDNGRWSVADPRMPAANDKLVAVIRSLDGTWHRPFTTLELAALQSIVDPEEYLELDGLSDSDWRERIGNAVPPDAAEAIAGVMGTTLLLAWSGETFVLSAAPIWVRPVAVALTVAQGGM